MHYKKKHNSSVKTRVTSGSYFHNFPTNLPYPKTELTSAGKTKGQVQTQNGSKTEKYQSRLKKRADTAEVGSHTVYYVSHIYILDTTGRSGVRL